MIFHHTSRSWPEIKYIYFFFAWRYNLSLKVVALKQYYTEKLTQNECKAHKFYNTRANLKVIHGIYMIIKVISLNNIKRINIKNQIGTYNAKANCRYLTNLITSLIGEFNIEFYQKSFAGGGVE